MHAVHTRTHVHIIVLACALDLGPRARAGYDHRGTGSDLVGPDCDTGRPQVYVPLASCLKLSMLST